LADLEDEWVEMAIKLAEATYNKFYKPAGTSNAQVQAPGGSQFGYSSYMSCMYSSVASTGPASPCPIREFMNSAPLLDHAKNSDLCSKTHSPGGTATMSANVKRTFSFMGSIVSKCRHNQSAYTIQATATLGSYSKASLVK
ncbi:hypothetical protein FRC10_011458, partial [Ceratobasidium sp. 414]